MRVVLREWRVDVGSAKTNDVERWDLRRRVNVVGLGVGSAY
jgi:hypothetical protein